MSSKLTAQYLFVFSLVLIAPLCSNAAIIQVSSLPGSDSILWSSLGGDLTALTPPVGLVTIGGSSATLTGSTNFAIFAGSTYNADFLPGDTVVSAFDLNTFTPLATGIEILFASPVLGAGAQIQANTFGAFVGTLEAFDVNLVSLGSVHVSSTVQGNGDGSAPFLGLMSDTPIKEVLFTADTAGVAINTLQIATPEPSGLFLVLPALAAAFAIRRKRR